MARPESNFGGLLEDLARAYIKHREGKRAVERQGLPVENEFTSQTETFIYERNMSAFDECRVIERPDHTFLGECGMEAFTPSIIDSREAQAVGVWLFDKDDVRTTSIVLIPSELPEDDKIVLSYRGEVHVAEVGKEIRVELGTLSMIIKVVEVKLPEAPGPMRPYFYRLMVEVTISLANKDRD